MNLGGAAEGTSCGSGKMCIQGVCTVSAKAPTSDCLFADEPVRSVQFNIYGITLPNSIMSCNEVIEYSINTLSYTSDDLCLNSNFKARCCNSCKSKCSANHYLYKEINLTLKFILF